METIDIFKSNELFKHLDDDELRMIVAMTTQKTVQKNALIINEGDSSSSMYLIKEGKVNVTVTNEEGKEFILSTLQQGDNFGELSLLDDNPRSANVIALEKCIFLVLKKADFYKLLQSNPGIAIRVIKYLCQRVRFISSIAQSLALMDVYGRLVKMLREFSSQGENGQFIVSMPLTHKDIASRLGCAREMVSKIINALKKGGYLSIENKIIIIHKTLPPAF